MKGSDALGYSLAVAAAFLSASSALPPQYLREMKNPRLEGRPGSEFAPVNGDGRGGPLGPPVDAKFSTTEAQSADYPTDARPDQGQSAPSGPVPNAPAATPPAPPPSTPGQPAPKPAPEQPAPKPAPEQPAPKPAPEQPAPKQPVPKPPAPAETGKGDDMACAKIQPEVEKFLKEHPKGKGDSLRVVFAGPLKQVSQYTDQTPLHIPTEQARIPAKMAYDCLQSVPNKVGPAQDMIRSLKAFVGWQSTLAFLKAPPRDYMLPPTDILGGLDDIADSAQKGQYKSEYEFQAAIVEHLVTAHDGHFSYRPDVFKAFTFRNKLIAKVASVSVDGAALPKLYHMG